MKAADIVIQRGGRFYHFTGPATKKQTMAQIKGGVAEQSPTETILTIALGDGPNDLAMIEAADFGVIMPNSGGVMIDSRERHVRIAPAPGPQGWVIAVRQILTELGLMQSEK